ncbi:MAG: DUF2298 domain-containing protein [Thermoflexus sp.]|uniref:DUF2298 domain-containing protein n=1 Tax=Thermoflexus sp. TaxID=1969742 RepID=UPI0025D8926B|nr:DUF2298 domain-containing protein [Thermoflexus sp.]MCS6963105.1 DUF2298 domain-containing protein [Thermoflexus sp.]
MNVVQPPHPRMRALLTAFALTVLMIVALDLRTVGLNWDENQHLHPDERFLTMVTEALDWPRSLGEYFDSARSPLNPYNRGYTFFVYGNLPIILTRGAGELLTALCQAQEALCPFPEGHALGYNEVTLLGRALSALLDAGTVLLTFWIGSELMGFGGGLLAAALMAFSVMNLQQAHFYTTDTWATFFSTAALLGLIRTLRRSGHGPWAYLSAIATGAMAGAALASRINLWPLFPLMALAALLDLRGQRGRWGPWLTAGFAALLAFRVGMPYAFAGWITPDPRWLTNMGEIQALISGAVDYPPGHQWTDRAPILFPLKNMVLWGMGLPFGLAAWLGWLGLGWALRRRLHTGSFRQDAIAIGWLLIWAWTGGYFLYMGTQWVKSMRYFLPIYPTLALTAAWGLQQLGRIALPGLRRLASLAIAGTLLGTMLWAVAFTTIYRQPVSRVAASRWLYAHVPSAVTLRLADSNDSQYPLSLPNQIPVESELMLPVGSIPAMTVIGIEIPHLRALSDPPGTLQLTLETPEGQERLRVSLIPPTTARHPDGDPVRVSLPEPIALPPGSYVMRLRAEGGPVLLTSSIIANEHWDDGLPLRLDGRDAFAMYQGLEMTWYDDDTEAKREKALEGLERADWIILSSQRLVWSIPRLPLRYPMTTAYYRSLFEGKLGFELAAAFHVKPRLGPLEIDDIGGRIGFRLPPLGFEEPFWGAEEAFSVYDHPPVWIFRKRPDFSIEQVRQILESVDLSQVIWQTPRQYTQARHLLMLDPAAWARQQTASTYRELFPPENPLNRWPLLGITAWLLFFLALAGWAWPLTAWAFPQLADRGYALAQLLGPLLFAFFPWLLASVGMMDFAPTAMILTLLAGLGVDLLLWPRVRPMIREALRDPLWRAELGVFLGAFALWLLIRLGHPDLWHPVMGGEKPMNLSYLLATIRSLRFPPYDPWFAGGYINYYYFGYVIVGAPMKLLGFDVRYAYNAAIPTLAAMTALGAFAIGAQLAKAWWPRGGWKPVAVGLFAALFAVGVGNLGELNLLARLFGEVGAETSGASELSPTDVLRGVGRVLRGEASLPARIEWWYWNPTRMIPDHDVTPITEFPYFTFLYADLHAHMMAFPLQLTALLIGLAWLRRLRWDEPSGVLALALGALVVGALRPTNTWDYPTHVLLGLAALTLNAWRRRDLQTWRGIEGWAARGLAFVGLGLLFFYPYIAHYATAYTSFELWKGDRTPLGTYFLLHGLFLTPILLLLLRESRRLLRWMLAGWTADPLGALGWVAAGAMGVGLWLLGGRLAPVAWIAVPMILVAAALALRPYQIPERRLLWIWVAAAAALTLGVELVVLKGDIGRMNTVFKFYLQVWFLWAVAAAMAVVALEEAARRWTPFLRALWRGLFGALLVSALLYPLLATPARLEDRWDVSVGPTLDGFAFMEKAVADEMGVRYPVRHEWEALQFLQAHSEGTPVVIESIRSPAYRGLRSRVAMFTGLPLVFGWDWHQRQQRTVVPESFIRRREADVNQFYETTDPEEAMAILRRYGVRYVMDGYAERLYYPPQGFEKFPVMIAREELRIAFDNGSVRIYEVTR